MSKHLVISTSGNPDSNSRRMGRVAFAHLQKKKVDCDWIDIREMDLPLCDADKCYGMPGSKKLSATIEHAEGILIAAPVYNYDVAAATKNMIELTGSAWENKIVGFVCAAGGHASYMSVMAYANSLMLDFRCVIIPRFAFATGDAFDGERINDKKITQRIEQVADEQVVARVEDEVVRSFWQNEFANWTAAYRTEAVSSVTNKLLPFLTSRQLRAIV